MHKMKFYVGPFPYTAILVDDWIDFEGKPRAALCVVERQQLLICRKLHPDQLVHAVAHEICEAYVHHFPASQLSKEDICDLTGNVALTLMKGLSGKQGTARSAQGGRASKAGRRPREAGSSLISMSRVGRARGVKSHFGRRAGFAS
jgi:hypothetical protein